MSNGNKTVMAKEWIFGFHAIEAALERQSVIQLWIANKRIDKRTQAILERVKQYNVPVNMVTMQAISDTVGSDIRHQGVIAEIHVKSALNESDLYELLENLNKPPLLLILDGVTDPHNVGACLRSAEAFGVDAVIVTQDRACGLTPIVRKISSGSSERIPFIEVVNLSRTIAQLKEQGIWVAGLAGEGTTSLYSADLKGALAIVMGAEGDGMRRLTKEQCDFLVKIPMVGAIESLNVSVATGVVLSESFRQRIQR